jgi:hypothetical protein
MSFPCPKCGKQLTLPGGKPKAPAAVRRPFGQIAKDLGLATAEQVEEAVAEQRTIAAKGKKARIGQVMVLKEFLMPAHVRDVLKRQGRLIFRCPKCRRGYNVSGVAGDGQFPCQHCNVPIRGADTSDDISAVGNFAVKGPGAIDGGVGKEDVDLSDLLTEPAEDIPVAEAVAPEVVRASPAAPTKKRAAPARPRKRIPLSAKQPLPPGEQPPAEPPPKPLTPWIIGGLSAFVAVVIALLILLLAGGGDGKKEEEEAPAPVTKEVPRPEPKQAEPPKPAEPEVPQDYQRVINEKVCLVNLSAITAMYLEHKSMHVSDQFEASAARKAARRLWEDVQATDEEVTALLKKLTDKGLRPKVGHYIRHNDRVMDFQGFERQKMNAAQAMQVYGTHVKEVRNGTRWMVVVKRGGSLRQLEIVFTDLPDTILPLKQKVDVLPAAGK